ncbi:hypothetical protein [Chitinophaga niastensis]|nr:hypothetical protein [Chitinophaga niastensis]
MKQHYDATQSDKRSSKAVAENNAGTGISRPAVQPVFSPQQQASAIQRMYNKKSDLADVEIVELKKQLIEFGLSQLEDADSAMTKQFNELMRDKARNYSEVSDIFDRLEKVTEPQEKEGGKIEKPLPEEKHTTADLKKEKKSAHESDDEEYEEDEEDEYNYEDDYYDDETFDTAQKSDNEDDKNITEDLKGVKAVVVVIGGKMKASQMELVKKVYNGLEKKPTDTEELAIAIYNTMEEATARGAYIYPSIIQQTIDQEIIHLDIAALASKKLTSLGAIVQLYRPPDSLLISPVPGELSGSFIAYAPGLENVAQFISTSERTIVVTIGHGGDTGGVNFPGIAGSVFPHDIGGRLGLLGRNANSFLYVPLQCYPQQAVRKARALQWHSVSIVNEDKSDDGELQRWVKGNLKTESKEWAQKTKGK